MNQEVITKKCSNPNCAQPIKPISEFHKNISQLDGLHNYCKICRKLKSIDYYIENKNSIKIKHKNYDISHKAEISLRKKQDRIKNPEKFKNSRLKYQKTNKVIIRLKAKISRRKRYHNDPQYKLSLLLRRRQTKALKGNKKYVKLNNYIDLKNKLYIENLFYRNMTWGLQGNGHNKWQIHHICPLEFFDLSDPIEQKQAFHYTNTQPLWYDDHCEIHKKINERMSQYENNEKIIINDKYLKEISI